MRLVGGVLAWTLFVGIGVLGFVWMYAFTRTVRLAGLARRVHPYVMNFGTVAVARFAFLGGWVLFDVYWLCRCLWSLVELVDNRRIAP